MNPTPETKEMFDQLHALAMINGFCLLKYDTTNGFEIVKPEQYNELIDAIKFNQQHKVQL